MEFECTRSEAICTQLLRGFPAAALLCPNHFATAVFFGQPVVDALVITHQKQSFHCESYLQSIHIPYAKAKYDK